VSDKIQPAAPISPDVVEKKRRFNGGLQPGVSVRGLPIQRVAVEPQDADKELLARVAKMDSKQFRKFKADPANVKALDEAQRRKRGLL
jgi:hypothetical protein